MTAIIEVSPRRYTPSNKPHIYKVEGTWRVTPGNTGLERFVFLAKRVTLNNLAYAWAGKMNSKL